MQAAIAAVPAAAPAGHAHARRRYQKVNPADQPILFIALTSPTLPLSALNEYAETMMAQRISMVSGVAQVQVYGAQKYAVRIQLDPQALASRGIGIDQVVDAVQNNNVNLPTGTLWGRDKAFTVQATGQLNTADAYRPIVVAYRNGAPVRLQDLGNVFDSVQNNKMAAWFRDTRCHHARHPAPAGHQHGGGGQRREGPPPGLPAASFPRRRTSTSCSTARIRSRNRSTT